MSMNQNNISLENVINGLECCQECDGYTCRNCCPYHDKNEPEDPPTCTCRLAHDALTLLKAQEPVEPKVIIYHIFLDGTCDISPRMVTCGACGECLPTGDATTKYCPTCGRPVKWK